MKQIDDLSDMLHEMSYNTSTTSAVTKTLVAIAAQ